MPIQNEIFCFKSAQVFLGECGVFFFNYIFKNKTLLVDLLQQHLQLIILLLKKSLVLFI